MGTIPQRLPVMIMAAGLGTRLRPFTDFFPKALTPLLGIPAIQYVIDASAPVASRFIVNAHHHYDSMISKVGSLDVHGRSLLISDERNLLLGSAGGLKKAADQISSPTFLFTNADVIFQPDWNQLIRHHFEQKRIRKTLMTLALLPASPTGEPYRELQIDPPNGRVISLGSKKGAHHPFFCGAGIIEAEALDAIPTDRPTEFASEVLGPALESHSVAYVMNFGRWLDLGSPQLWAQAHHSLLVAMENEEKTLPWRQRILDQNIKVAPQVWISRTTQLDPNTQWEAPCYLSLSGSKTPERVGPNLFHYGPLPRKSAHLKNTIGFNDIQVMLI